jgi:CheY-like chemotaxis protein
MSNATGFLSYTRIDDEFHGGYITSFRKTLENAVHVVTGERTFKVFQDVEGIVIGEQWKKKLAEVIHESSFFVPMLTPLFFNSQPCREELFEFLQHERSLDRDDLILPIYFFTSPKLEKEEERAKDPLAIELGKRQVFDWREKADVPLDQPVARRSIVELAGEIARRLPDVPVTKRSARIGSVDETRAEADAVAADPHLATGVVGNLKREAPQSRSVLWVDDSPRNNLWERKALESYGMRFALALDTTSAQRAILERGPFAAIISDMGRPGDKQAGMTLLEWIRENKIDTPYFIYTTSRSATLLRPLVGLRGGQGITANPDELVEMVVAATR